MIIYGARGLAAREQAHTLLARAAGLHWGLPSLPTIGRRQWGKPYFPARPELEFNLSHSGPFALCALDSAPVGVDIQTVRPRRPALLRRVCAPEELAWLEGRGDLWSAFALLWALKESRVKESGRGLTSPISAISYGSGWVRPGDMIKWGFITSMLCVLTAMTVGLAIGNAF